MDKKLILILLGLCLFLIPLTTALNNNNLEITPNNINITKVLNQNITKQVILSNHNTYPLYNINFQNNPYISLNTSINKLLPGQNTTTTLNIFSNQNINKIIKLIGYRNMSSVGSSDNNYTIDIISSDLKCDSFTSLIVGDTINFINNNTFYDIKVQTPSKNIITIPKLSSKSLILNENGEYLYYLDNAFSNIICDLNVQSLNGLVAEFYNFNLTTNIEFPQTSIIAQTFTNKYTMNFFDTKSDTMKVMNNGNTTAYDIHLSGDWFTFNTNDFNLKPGQSQNINYNINPANFITTTNQTNKTYVKNITISGNFKNYTQSFNIHINQAIINENKTNQTGFIEYVKEFCKQNPTICGSGQQIIYKTVGDNKDIKLNLTQNQAQQLFEYMITTLNNVQLTNDIVKAKTNNISENINNINKVIQNNTKNIQETHQNQQTQTTWVTLFWATLIFVILIFLGYGIYYYYQKESRVKGINLGGYQVYGK